jgi:hypothetical protein
MSAFSKAAAIAEAYGTSLISAPLRLLPRRRLTDTYLRDAAVLRHADASPEEEEHPVRLVR